MSQAFNLSQFANTSINALGQISVSNGIESGAVLGISRGGVGLTDPGANYNLLKSNGTAWVSTPITAGLGLKSITFNSTNGFNITTTNPTTTPTILFSTSLGSVATPVLLKGDAATNSLKAAIPGTDYQAPITATTNLTVGNVSVSPLSLPDGYTSGGGITVGTSTLISTAQGAITFPPASPSVKSVLKSSYPGMLSWEPYINNQTTTTNPLTSGSMFLGVPAYGVTAMSNVTSVTISGFAQYSSTPTAINAKMLGVISVGKDAFAPPMALFIKL